MWITGFDAQCVSTVYLDKPIKGHTLMQTIARANRVYDDEKENGLIVDYGNVYEQLEKAYSVYGEGGTSGGGKGTGPEKPIADLSELQGELIFAIEETIKHLGSLGFDLESLKNASPMLRISKLQEAENCVCLNEKTRATFEVMAQNVFRKYKALFPEPQAKAHTKDHNAIEAIYKQLNKKAKSADVTEVMKKLQSLVSDSISVKQSDNAEGVYIDLSNLDFDKLKSAFAKSDQKNTMTYTLQQVIENKLEQMLKENPLRVEFYERYKEIIDAYNAGKSLENTVKAFDDLNDFVKDLSVEEQRAVRENLGDQEVLAIFDLLTKGKELNSEDVKKVKKVAKDTLDKLKAEKLSIERWRESREVIAQVKIVIHDNLLWLPQESYSDEDVDTKATDVYQHIFASYRGGNDSVYRMSA
jgi:type I restriction enzyme R subunit